MSPEARLRSLTLLAGCALAGVLGVLICARPVLEASADRLGDSSGKLEL